MDAVKRRRLALAGGAAVALLAFFAYRRRGPLSAEEAAIRAAPGPPPGTTIDPGPGDVQGLFTFTDLLEQRLQDLEDLFGGFVPGTSPSEVIPTPGGGVVIIPPGGGDPIVLPPPPSSTKASGPVGPAGPVGPPGPSAKPPAPSDPTPPTGHQLPPVWVPPITVYPPSRPRVNPIPGAPATYE